MSTNRAAWQRDMATPLERDQRALRAAVEAWAAARRTLQEHRSLAAWVAGFPARTVYKVTTPTVDGVTGANGSGTPFEDVHAALLSEAEPAERAEAA